ncbi:zinc finger protein 90-like [Maniola jurtina]|uniref:zinc finger protein 90-like n=1 Tax=Maniola jurtina TaxID=191418 RepID=UPI001E6896D8|nr:zinc finger protein 90-like [Maniola jurtina]XP_045783475.1 zinc finger protein 90-like [Maniola jurtina]
MRCCVPFCNNSSKYTLGSQGDITYHKFPVNPGTRKCWLKALNKDEASLPTRAAVCSQHFLFDDFYVSKTGLRKVRADAVPLVVHVCLICLDTESKMYPLNKYKLKEPYRTLTGIALEDKDKMPKTLCGECAHRLLNFNKFREKSERAHSLMLRLVKEHKSITIQNVKTINRHENDLISKLVHKQFEPNNCDLYILEDVEDNLTVLDKTDLNEKTVTVKHENFTYTNENYIETKDELSIDHEVLTNDNLNHLNSIKDSFNDGNADDGLNNDNVTASNDNVILNNVKNENSDNDADFLPNNDCNDYSTDDSLPLETKRKKILKKEKSKTKKAKVKSKVIEPKIDRRRKPFLNTDLNETLFTITDLSFDEQVADIRKRQETANYKNSPFKCTLCFKGFLDEDAYNGHMSRHTDQCGEYECEICKTHFKHSHALRKHITAHHTQRFSCNSCPYITTHRQTARLHERWHKGTKYQCPHCPDEFVKFTTYMGHIRIKHPSDFVCALCGYSFVSEKGIDLHKKLKHRLDDREIPEDGPFCELCNVRFVSEVAYKRHRQVSAKHNTDSDAKEKSKGRKPREIKEKSKNDSSERNERRMYPSQMRKAEGPISCEQCGMQLEDSRAYHGHFRRHHPDKNRTNYPSMKSPFMCESCGRMFQSYALLKDHRWVHTGERPFACDACGKSFRMKQRLVAHRRVHSQVRATYVCNLCGKSFSTHSNRQRHMVIHTGLKPFKCEMCGKCFKHSSEKRAHITYVHLKKPWPKRARGKRRSDRPRQLQPLGSVPAGVSEMDIAQQAWGACDPKHHNMNIMEDKPVYFSNIKVLYDAA